MTDKSDYSVAILICPVCGYKNEIDVSTAVNLVDDEGRGSYETPSGAADPDTLNVYGESAALGVAITTCRNCDASIK